MESHLDRDYVRPTETPIDEFMGRLGARAADALKTSASVITAGAPGEKALAEWEYGRVQIRQLPEDEQRILRISLGGGIAQAEIDYCVFRGDRTRCAYLLELAAEALRAGPDGKASKP